MSRAVAVHIYVTASPSGSPRWFTLVHLVHHMHHCVCNDVQTPPPPAIAKALSRREHVLEKVVHSVDGTT